MGASRQLSEGRIKMLWTIAVILVALWLLSLYFALGGFIHILLLLALAVVFIRIIQGRRRGSA